MKPIYLITANGEDITSKLKGRLQSASIVDADGESADTLQLDLVDSPSLEIPGVGAELHVELGYRETGLTDMGLYISDSVETDGPPDKIKIGAAAAAFAQSSTYKRLQDKQTRSWEPGTLGVVAKTIASEHGLEAKFNGDTESISLPHMDQTSESDISFLHRIADKHDVVTKISYGLLTLAVKGDNSTATGKTLPTIKLKLSDLSTYSTKQKEKVIYDTVKAYYHDTESAETEEVSVGTGQNSTEIKGLQENEFTAKQVAKTELAKYQRKGLSGRISMAGRTDITSGSPIEITDGKKPLKGSWKAVKVTHNFGDSGWSISVELESA